MRGHGRDANGSSERGAGEHSMRIELVNRTRAETAPRSPEDEHNGAAPTILTGRGGVKKKKKKS